MMINNGGVNLHCQIFLVLAGHSFKNLRITSTQNSKTPALQTNEPCHVAKSIFIYSLFPQTQPE